MNTSRVVSECVAKGNSEYAFYSAYYGNASLAPVLSGLCQDVMPVYCNSSTMCPELIHASKSDCCQNRHDLRHSLFGPSGANRRGPAPGKQREPTEPGGVGVPEAVERLSIADQRREEQDQGKGRRDQSQQFVRDLRGRRDGDDRGMGIVVP